MSAVVVDGPARGLRALPSPPGWPLLGHLPKLAPQRLHLTLEAWAAAHGPMYRVRVPGRDILVCSDSVLLQQVLRERPERYRRAAAIESVLREMGANGVFSVEGEAWRPQRKLVMQALAATHLRGFHDTLAGITRRLHDRWARAAEEGRELDLRDELTRYTVDVTTALAFGEDPRTLDDRDDVIQKDLALIFPMLMRRVNAPFPWWRVLRLPSDRRFDRALARVREHVRGLIDRAEARRAAQPEAPPRHLLDVLLRERDRGEAHMSDEDVLANVFTLLLAGEDTTAHTLAWAMHYVAHDAALQDRLHARARELLGADPVCASHEGLRGLDEFEALATEALRLRPTVPLLFLEPNEDVELGGVRVPRRTLMMFLTRPDMLRAEHFGEPQAFRPERWTAPEAGCPHQARAHLQFGAGPRVCPGRFLAGAEMRLVLAMLLHAFRVQPVRAADAVQEVMAFTMMPDRMPVRLERRAA